MRTVTAFFAIGIALLVAGPGLSVPPQPTMQVTAAAVTDCTSIRVRADWERVRISDVRFTFVFGDASSHQQTLPAEPRPSRAGFLEIVLANDSHSPFANGAGSVRADFLDPKGNVEGSDARPFTLSACS